MKYIKIFEEFFIGDNGLVDKLGGNDEFVVLNHKDGIDDTDLTEVIRELDLNNRDDFNTFVEIVENEWNGSARKTTTYGYTFEVDPKYKSELENLGINWYTEERVTNKEHPNFGKSYIEFNMMKPEIK